MPTLQYQGQTVNFTHPRELATVLPIPPLQPLASYATELAQFQAALTALIAATDGGVRRTKLFEARGVLVANHLQATTANCPGGTVHALVADQMRGEYGLERVPGYFGGAPSAWV